MDTTETPIGASPNRRILVECLLEALKEKGLIWVSGPRDVGKTAIINETGLLQTGACLVDCEVAAQVDRLSDPHKFFNENTASVVVLDEVHLLDNFEHLLSLGLEHPERRIIAISSSVVSPPRSLANKLIEHQHIGPLRIDELPPVKELLSRRLHHGGMPAAFLSSIFPAPYYRRWLDSFLVRDFLSRYGCRKVPQLLALFRRLFQGSGGIFKRGSLARSTGTTHKAIKDWLAALEAMRIVTVVPPIGKKGKEQQEFRRIYAFDTGLVCDANGWAQLNAAAFECLWKHIVLAQLQARYPEARIACFEEEGAHLDFIIPQRVVPIVDAFDARWSRGDYDFSAFDTFRHRYPLGNNVLLCPDAGGSLVTRGGNIIAVRSPVDFVPIVTRRVRKSEIRVFPRREEKQKHASYKAFKTSQQISLLFKRWFVGELAKLVANHQRSGSPSVPAEVRIHNGTQPHNPKGIPK
jgi:predicted AAA+ superfamily ATPase